MTATISDHRRRKLGWTPYAWLIYLVFYIASPALNNGTWRDWAWTLGTVAVFLPLYFEGFRSTGRRLLVIVWIIHGLGVAAAAVNPGGSCFFIYAAAFLGFTGPPPKALRWLGAMLLVTGIEAYLLPWPLWVWIPAIVVSAVVSYACFGRKRCEPAYPRTRPASSATRSRCGPFSANSSNHARRRATVQESRSNVIGVLTT